MQQTKGPTIEWINPNYDNYKGWVRGKMREKHFGKNSDILLDLVSRNWPYLGY